MNEKGPKIIEVTRMEVETPVQSKRESSSSPLAKGKEKGIAKGEEKATPSAAAAATIVVSTVNSDAANSPGTNAKKKFRKNYVGKPSTAKEISDARRKFRKKIRTPDDKAVTPAPMLQSKDGASGEPGKKFLSKKERLAKKEEEKRNRL